MTHLVRTLFLFCVLSVWVFLPSEGMSQEEEKSVSFQASDGVTLRGHLLGEGTTTVILGHMFQEDQKSWTPFAGKLSVRGFQVLTFDFRGYGESDGAKEVPLIDRDMAAAVDFVRSQGSKKVFLVGASMGAIAALKTAARRDVDGVIALSAPKEFRGLSAEKEIPLIAAPKLFIVSKNEVHVSVAEIKEQYESAVRPKEFKVFPGSAHGRRILDGEEREAVEATMISFLSHYASE